MRTFITVEKAKEEIIWLQNYIQVAESYETNTIERRILKEYAHIGNSLKVATQLNTEGLKINKREILPQDVTAIIRSKATDELHKIVKRGFQYKYRGKKR
ncbi:hypothetical protein [Bacillus cabrialesii]|uniref:Uncharacterized protein n=1 Tax=Bacillus cabrialesii subsp. tritici TaxID=2944916 RepID=A0ABT9DH15_9BACI|nr:hypothetical protein [Bacillus cabrialesii]MDO8223947.1 hypothetical protein [Bacillus cabrialesii subsp. tritici]